MATKYPKIAYRGGKRYFFRFSLVQRIQHIILFTCVITLSLTGFPLRYHDQPWAEPLYNFFGGIDVAPWIHRGAGSILLCLFVFHTGYWIYVFCTTRLARLIRENRLTFKSFWKEFFSQEMIPNGRDGRDIVDMFKYLLYLSPNPPKYDRICWKEKFDYFAPYWGIPILGPAGLALGREKSDRALGEPDILEPRPSALAASGADQTGVRVYNERLILSLMRRRGHLSKIEAARQTGLSVQTASAIMNHLQADGLLKRETPQRGRVGQPTVPFSLDPEGAFSLGLKIEYIKPNIL